VACLRVFLLGLPRVETEQGPLDVSSRKAVALLAYLAVDGEQSRDGLASLLWPDSDHTRARTALRKALSILNGVLGGRWLVSRRSRVALDSNVEVDVQTFRAALQGVDDHGHAPDALCEACLDALTGAAEMYGDDFLAGFGVRDSATFDDWQRQVAEELRLELMTALGLLVESHTSRGQFDTAITHATRRLSVDPLHEPTHRQLMLLHAWTGDRAEAVRQYERCTQLLERALGIAPMDETTQVHDAVLAGDPPPPPAPPASNQPPSTARTSSLVGRHDELRQISRSHAQSVSGGRLVAVEGEAGIGRTALLSAVVADARERGATVVSLRCRDTEQSLPYALVADAIRNVVVAARPGLADVPPAWLAEAARLVPELLESHPDLVPAPAVDATETRRRLLEGIRRTLLGGIAGTVPGMVVIDDLQWADGPSLDALLYLADRSTDPPCCLVLSWRSDAVPADHRLRRLVADHHTRGLAEVVRLTRLNRDDVALLVAAADRDDPDGALADRLHQETQGLPLLVTQYLRGLPQGPVDPSTLRPPPGAQELVRAHLDGISDQARNVAVTAAVIGHPFDLPTLLEASGLDAGDAVAALDELLSAGILDEQVRIAPTNSLTYEFQFQPLRTLLYEDTSQTLRRLLHGRAADALTDGPQALTPATHAIVADHLRRAGRDRDAAQAFVRAAEAAHQVVALDEATDHLRSALALGHPEPGSLQKRLGELETLRGDYPAALRALRSATSDMPAPTEQARLELDIARIHERRGNWDQAEQHLQQGLDHLRDEPTAAQPDRAPLEARLHAELALTAHRQNDANEARRRGEHALDLAQSAGDPWATARAHNTLGMVLRADESFDQAVEHLQQARQLADHLDDPAASVAALNNLALTHADRGDRSRALELAKTALARCRRRGDRHREAALLNNLADLLHAADRPDEARTHIAEAVSLFADIDRPNHLEPEIWKLVDW
jgi:predicted ATPase/DNA-binding SARP family transcriptional activator